MECHANLDTISDQEVEMTGRQKLVERTRLRGPSPVFSIGGGLSHAKPTDTMGIEVPP